MKTLVVLSDTHGNKRAINSIREILEESDYIIHLGDYVSDIQDIKNQFPEKTFTVMGNCDSLFYQEKIIEVENKKILLTHGHKYGVKTSLEALKTYAIDNHIDIVLYGHTHIAKTFEEKGILYLNPGTISSKGNEKTYAYIIIHNGKIITKTVNIY